MNMRLTDLRNAVAGLSDSMTAVRDCTARLLEALPSLILVSGKYATIPPVLDRINQLRGALNEAENAMAEVIGNGVIGPHASATLTVTGTLDPDVTGEYTRIADVNGHYAWKHPSLDWFLWYSNNSNTYSITPIAGTFPNSPDPWWANTEVSETPEGLYEAVFDASGYATVS